MKEKILKELFVIYATHLLDRKDVLAYLKGRNITNRTRNKFCLGYCDYNIGYKTLSKEYSDKELLESELFRELDNGNIIDYFYKRLVIPIIKDKKIVFFTSRSLGDSKIKHLHQPGKINYAVNFDIIKKSKSIVLVEGPFDCMTLDQNGIPSIGLLGAGRITRHLIEALKNKKVYICFDSEPNRTGSTMSIRLAKKLIIYGIKSRIIEIPDEGEKVDINSYFEKHQPHEFRNLIQKSKLFDKSSLKLKKSVKNNSKLDILDVANKYMKVLHVGGRHKAVCPFHGDNDPSLIFYPETNTFYCFGCSMHGNAVTLIRKYENDRGNRISYDEALKLGKTI